MNQCATNADRVAAAASFIRRSWSCEAKAAVILGTQLSIIFSKAGTYMTNAAAGVPTSP